MAEVETNQDSTPSDESPLKRELLGYVWVDSGQLVISDPNYIHELDQETLDNATSLKNRAKMIMDGMAAAFRVGIRNGRYPVFVTRFANGVVAKFEVELDERLSAPPPKE